MHLLSTLGHSKLRLEFRMQNADYKENTYGQAV
jgi:hypothetical protein